VELLGAEPLTGGEYPVVFSNLVSPAIFSMFSSPFHAEVVQKGQSRLEGKIGHQIAVTELNLVCDPHIVGAPGSRLFDGEGILCKRTEVVSHGVLKMYLYNLESAKKEGRPPTGHASRGYSGKVGTGFSNFLVGLGKKNLDDLLSAYPKAFFVTKLEGGAGCSPVSGEISIGAQGFLYEQGKRIRPVDRVTINSNFFDLLMNIRGLSDQYSDRFSSFKVPDVLIEKMHVAG
jgi:PmbA protein